MLPIAGLLSTEKHKHKTATKLCSLTVPSTKPLLQKPVPSTTALSASA